ncbi:MAG: BamA/TamA family outer membrane protein, partial [Polyangiaceae bacterium]
PNPASPAPNPASPAPNPASPSPNPASQVDSSSRAGAKDAKPTESNPAHADNPGFDYFKRRYEPAGFPLIGGNSDIGFELGAVGTLSYFADGVKPYAWNQDLLASWSFKGGPTGGIELAQQSYQWNIDWLDVLGQSIRLVPQAAYTRTINVGYFGLGDASSDTVPGPPANRERYFEFVENLLYARTIARIHLGHACDILAAGTYRYVVPEAYADSKLAADERAPRGADGSPLIRGTRPLSLLSVAGGFGYDSRDNEVFTTRGMYHQVGLRLEQGIPLGDDVRYGEAGAILTDFQPITGPVMLATRIVASFQFGRVPFYDLLQAGPFQLKELPGGSSGVRGVPIGRYLGPIKVVGNAELRALPIHFELFKQKFHVGGDLFVDTGRVWSDYSFRSPLDGRGIGLKYGVGTGLYFLWGQAAIFRVEAAYSPDAISNGGPIGLYVEDGTMF